MRPEDLSPPDTAAVRAARELAERYLPPALAAHPRRTDVTPLRVAP